MKNFDGSHQCLSKFGKFYRGLINICLRLGKFYQDDDPYLTQVMVKYVLKYDCHRKEVKSNCTCAFLQFFWLLHYIFCLWCNFILHTKHTCVLEMCWNTKCAQIGNKLKSFQIHYNAWVPSAENPAHYSGNYSSYRYQDDDNGNTQTQRHPQITGKVFRYF